MDPQSPLVLIGRVLHEDADFVTLEVPKSLHRELRIEEGDRFLTIVFVHNVEGAAVPWTPWETT